MITVLAGGVGASRFLQGLVQVMAPGDITVVSNTGDDMTFHGLHISPDVDIVIYAMAGAVNPETGFGLAGDTFNAVDGLTRYGHERWFNLGDRDLATAIHRTELLTRGVPLHEAVATIAAGWGLESRVLPMSDERVETRIVGPAGELAFQDYMVRLRTEVEVLGIRFAGAESASPAPGVVEALKEVDAVVIAPSNPLVSIGPILAVPGIREALESSTAKRVAISPIIAGHVIKGPAAKMLQTLGHEVSAVGVARIYQGLIDVMVIDEQDRPLAAEVERLGMRCVVTDTIMSSDERKAALAAAILDAVS